MELDLWTQSLVTAMTALWTKVANFIPNLFGALVVVLLGFVVAKLLDTLLSKLLAKFGLDRRMAAGEAPVRCERDGCDPLAVAPLDGVAAAGDVPRAEVPGCQPRHELAHGGSLDDGAPVGVDDSERALADNGYCRGRGWGRSGLTHSGKRGLPDAECREDARPQLGVRRPDLDLVAVQPLIRAREAKAQEHLAVLPGGDVALRPDRDAALAVDLIQEAEDRGAEFDALELLVAWLGNAALSAWEELHAVTDEAVAQAADADRFEELLGVPGLHRPGLAAPVPAGTRGYLAAEFDEFRAEWEADDTGHDFLQGS